MKKGGDKKVSTEFHECVAWAKLAEICHKYLKKGKLVYLEGYIKTRSWDDDNGGKRFRTEIVVEDMIMLDKRSGEDSSSDSSYEHEDIPEVDDEGDISLEDNENIF